MSIRAHTHRVWLAILCAVCCCSSVPADEYGQLFRRHKVRARGETHARISADLVILGRTEVDATDLLFENQTLSNPILNASQLEFKDLPTGRYDVVLTDNTPWELQFTLFGFPDSREARATRTAPDIRAFVFGALDAPGPFDDPDTPTDTFGVVYESKLGSGELNLRRRLGDRVTLLSGLRYVGLQEDFDFVSLETSTGGTNGNGTTFGNFIDVNNALYGYQLGIESIVWSRGRARLVLEGRGGVYVNHMELDFEVEVLAADPDDPPEQRVLDVDSDRGVFVGDLRVTLMLPLGGGSLRMGYQLLGISRAALAPDQLDDFNILSETGAFDLASPVYMGGFVGLELPF